MYEQIALMLILTTMAVIAIASSRFLRAICLEAIFRRREHCRISVTDKGVSVERFNPNQEDLE